MGEDDGGTELPVRVLLDALEGDDHAMQSVIEHYVRIALEGRSAAQRDDGLGAKLRQRVPLALARWISHCEAVQHAEQANVTPLSFAEWLQRERRVLELDGGGRQRRKPMPWPDADPSLVQAAILGDREALVALIKFYQRPVFEMLGRAFDRGRFLSDRAPEDLAQVVFLRLMERLRSGEAMQLDMLSRWVITITKNLIRDEARRKKRINRLLGEPVQDEHLRELIGTTPPADGIRKEVFEAALGQLPEADRELLLRSADGESLRDIAKTSGVTHNAIARRLAKARTKLRRALRALGAS